MTADPNDDVIGRTVSQRRRRSSERTGVIVGHDTRPRVRVRWDNPSDEEAMFTSVLLDDLELPDVLNPPGAYGDPHWHVQFHGTDANDAPRTESYHCPAPNVEDAIRWCFETYAHEFSPGLMFVQRDQCYAYNTWHMHEARLAGHVGEP